MLKLLMKNNQYDIVTFKNGHFNVNFSNVVTLVGRTDITNDDTFH
jgi:hypothetical protein